MGLTREDCSYIRYRYRFGGRIATLKMIRQWQGCCLDVAQTVLQDCLQRRPWTAQGAPHGPGWKEQNRDA